MDKTLESIALICGVTKEIAEREPKNSLVLQKDGFVKCFEVNENTLTIAITRNLTRKPNYKLLNDLNTTAKFGHHAISDDLCYSFDFGLIITDDTSKQKLEDITKMCDEEAKQGFTIMNTSSKKKRDELLGSR